MFSKKAIKIDEIFTDNLTLCSGRQIDGEDFVNFCGLPRKHELLKAAKFKEWLTECKLGKFQVGPP